MSQYSERAAILFALAAVLLWSTVATAFKLALTELAPAQLLLLATLISSVIFWLAAAGNRQWSIPRSDWPLVLGLGALNPTLYYLTLFAAYDRLPAQIAQPLNYTWAMVLALLAVPLLRQPLTRRILVGLLVSYLGVVVLLRPTDALAEPLSSAGIALALLSTLLWALYWLLLTRSRSAPLAAMAWSFSLALPVVALVCWWQDGWPALATLSDQTLLSATWVGVVEMGITFLLWRAALARSSNVGRLSQLIFVSPFLSLLLIGAVLEETIAVTSWLGLGIIVIGLVIAQSRR